MRLRYALLLLFFITTIPVSGITYEMTWTYENRGESIYNMSSKDLGVPVFMETDYQRVEMESGYEDSRLLVLEDGFVKLVPIEPILVPIGETYTVHARYTIESQPRPVPSISIESSGTPGQIPTELASYIVPNALYPSDDPEIASLATELTSGENTVLGKVSALLDWFEEYSTYTITEVPRSPLHTIRDPRGDCDDLSLLFITMCRSRGIPAYMQGGLILGESIDVDEADWEDHYRYVFDGAGWHAWAMVYVPPWGWLPVDLTFLGGMNPLETITEAYYWRETTIVAWNITGHDYVLDEVEQREALIESDVYWYQYDTLVTDTREKDNKVYYIIAGSVLLAGYLLYRYQSRGLD